MPSPAPLDQPAAVRHAAMLAQLQRPGALAGWAGKVHLLQTHISSLLVAGERVYKFKRPVNFGFLDFSTLAARQAACEDELRLNRRTAPELYLAVLPVLAGPAADAGVGDPVDNLANDLADDPADMMEDGLSAGPAAGRGATIPAADAGSVAADNTPAVIDWAVQMRRFDADQGFDRLADAGRLQPAMVDALASALTQFHAGLPPAPACYGQADDTRAWARTNLKELAALVAGDAALARRLARLAHWSETRGAALAPQMTVRQSRGLVREVHGDLHLGNVVWHEGAPLLFDAMEFSAAFRHTDTVGDLAFMAMDLMAHGLPGLAWRFVNAALDASGDHDALALLPWWMVYRALVRAKVARLGAAAPAADADADADADAGQALAWPADAERYLLLAEALAEAGPQPAPQAEIGAQPAPQAELASQPAAPRLVLMMGLSGSGKSAVAGVLAEHLPAVRLRSDVLRKRLFGLAPHDRAAPSLGLYSPEANAHTYTRLHDLAAVALAGGLNVVVDAASLRQDERASLAALAHRQGARHSLLVCTAPAPVLAARVGQRAQHGQDASDATLAVLARQQQWVQWPGADEAAHTLVISTDAPRAHVAERARALFAPAARLGHGNAGSSG